jgi:TrmH family RNA methyltransferase
VITSRQHPLVKTFRAAARGDQHQALLDGWHLLHDAIEAGLDVTRVAVSHAPAREHLQLLERARRTASVVDVSPSVMDALSPVRAPTGVVALVTRPHVDPARFFDASPPLVVVAVDVQDPGNAGTIIRAAEAGGATGVILAGVSADAWGWKALRATMGSIFRLPVMRVADAGTACDLLRARGVRLMAAVPRDGRAVYDVRLDGATALLLGGEGPGLTDAMLQSADDRISVPMQGAVESLNVAMAATVLIYEAFRQRRATRSG